MLAKMGACVIERQRSIEGIPPLGENVLGSLLSFCEKI
jgi:hypothetical protein